MRTRLSKDLLVAITIHKYQPVLYKELVRVLVGLVKEEKIPGLLRSLADWGITTTEYRFGGRVYMVAMEADKMIAETREIWEEGQKEGSWWWKLRKWLKI